jgi:hypothetical protein
MSTAHELCKQPREVPRDYLPMADDTLLSDDFVADLLAKEAQDCSLKYSTMGLEAYRATRRVATIKIVTQEY